MFKKLNRKKRRKKYKKKKFNKKKKIIKKERNIIKEIFSSKLCYETNLQEKNFKDQNKNLKF